MVVSANFDLPKTFDTLSDRFPSIVRSFYRWKWLFLFMVIAGALSGFFLVMRMEPIFYAEVEYVFIEEDAGYRNIETQMDYMASNYIKNQVINAISEDSWRQIIGRPEYVDASIQDSALTFLDNETALDRKPNSNLILMTVKHPSALVAAEIAQKYVETIFVNTPRSLHDARVEEELRLLKDNRYLLDAAILSAQKEEVERLVEVVEQQEALVERLKAGSPNPMFEVLGGANPSSEPLPRPFLNAVVVGALIGLAGTILSVWVISALHKTIGTPEDIHESLDLPLFGVIPYVAGGELLTELQDPTGALTEAYYSVSRPIVAWLEGKDEHVSSSVGGKLGDIVHVTSCEKQDGKSSLVVGIGLSLTRLGKKVLVVDADMRRPSFGVGGTSSVGLSGLLISDRDPLDHVIVSKFTALSLLPSGIVPPNPAQLLGTPRLERILEQLRPAFDIILIDSPPTLGLADAPLISALADTTLFVVRSNRSRVTDVKNAYNRLIVSGANLSGFVLSQYKASHDRSYRYYTYHSYGDAEKSAEGEARQDEERVRVLDPDED